MTLSIAGGVIGIVFGLVGGLALTSAFQLPLVLSLVAIILGRHEHGGPDRLRFLSAVRALRAGSDHGAPHRVSTSVPPLPCPRAMTTLPWWGEANTQSNGVLTSLDVLYGYEFTDGDVSSSSGAAWYKG